MTREQRMGHLSMLAASVMWGMMAPISKAAMNSDAVSAMLVADVRIFGAAALFWILSFFTKGEKILDKWDYVRLFFAGLFAILLNQCVYVTGVSMTSPVDASIITTTLPIVTMIFAAIFIKEPITGMKAGGVLLGACGALLLVFGNRLIPGASETVQTARTSNLTGDLLCFISQTEYAELAYVLVFGTFLCYLIVPVGQKFLRPTLVAMYNYVQPVVATVVAIIWGMDTFNILKIIAVVLIFAGVLLVNRSKARYPEDQG